MFNFCAETKSNNNLIMYDELCMGVVQKGYLRWYGQVVRKNVQDWVSKCRRFRGRGRPRKTWEQSVKCDIRKYGTCRGWSRLIWKSGGVVVGLTVQSVRAWKKGRYKLFE